MNTISKEEDDEHHQSRSELLFDISSAPITEKVFDGEEDPKIGREKLEESKGELIEDNSQHKKKKVILEDEEDQEQLCNHSFQGFEQEVAIKEANQTSNMKPKHIFIDVEEFYRETPQDIVEDYKPSFAEGKSFSSQNSTHDWYEAKLEEIGLKVKPSDILKVIRQHPEETSKEFIIETLIQKYYDGNFSEDEDPPRRSSLLIPSAHHIPSLYFAPSASRNQNNFYCYSCFITQPGESTDYSIFDCWHSRCHDCLQKMYQALGDEVKKDLSGLTCSYLANCRGAILLDKFYNIIPEAEEHLYGFNKEEIGTCDICFDTVRGPKEALQIFNCNEHFYCYSCTKTHIKEHLENFKVLKLKCPHEDCGGSINEERMQKIVSAQLFEKYTKFKKNALVDRNPNLKWCSRPGCEQIVERSDGQRKAVCQCGQETCFDCGNQWHKTKSCEKAMKDLYKFYAKTNGVQICPECKSRVEKAEGCNHMTCLVCTYEWCWLCKGEYSKNHYDTFNALGCPGLMSGHNTRQNWGKCKLYGFRFLIFLGILFAIATFPVWIIILAILVPNIAYSPAYHRGKCTVCVLRTLLFIGGFCIFPLTLAVGAVAAVVPGSCYLFAYIFKFFKTKIENKRRRRRLIKERRERENYNDVDNLENDLERPLFNNSVDYQHDDLIPAETNPNYN